MHTRRLLLLTLPALAIATVFGIGTARADWPDHPIKWVVPFGPGGANDLIARAAAEAVGKRLGQPIVIENKPGAGAIIGADYVAKAKPDGYTWLIGAAGVVTNSILRTDMPYADADLIPVGMIAVAPSVIVVNPSVPANNLKEFVAWAKTQGARHQLGHRRRRQHAPLRRGDAARRRREHHHRSVQERLGRHDGGASKQRRRNVGGEHRGAAAGEGGKTQGRRNHLQQAHQLHDTLPTAQEQGFAGCADRPLGGTVRAQGHATGHRGTDEPGTRSGSKIRRISRQDGAFGHRARTRHHRSPSSRSSTPSAIACEILAKKANMQADK